MIFLISILGLFLQDSNPDDLLGYWEDADKESTIYIYKEGGKYYGKMTEIYHPYWEDGRKKIDEYNPDKSLRDRPFKGIVLLLDLEWNGEEYVKGKIYDPTTGKTYSCKGELDGFDKFQLRGYIGFSIFGSTTTWTRKK